jgi:hypothetical protein
MNDVADFVKNFANSSETREINEFFAKKFETIAQHPDGNLKIIKTLDPSKHT